MPVRPRPRAAPSSSTRTNGAAGACAPRPRRGRALRRWLGIAAIVLVGASVTFAAALVAGLARPADVRQAARAAGSSVQELTDALRALGQHLADVRLLPLGVALLLSVVNLLLRGAAWRSIVAAAHARSRVPYWPLLGAYCAGVGVNAVLPARAGAAVKVMLAHRRVEGASYTALGATLIAETLFDALVGIALIAWAWRLGVLPSLPSLPHLPLFEISWYARHPWILVVALAALGLLALWGAKRIRAFWARVRQGLAILATPRRYLLAVALPQALGWACRIAAAGFFLEAFGVSAGVRTALLVQAAGSLATIAPATPGGLGPKQALIVVLLADAAQRTTLLAFSVGMQLALTALEALLGSVSLVVLLRGLHLRRALQAARQRRRDGRPREDQGEDGRPLDGEVPPAGAKASTPR
jgi:glycosyltransferase 2 family protein